MLQIIVNGQSLLLYKDTTLQMELNSSIFADDAIEGDVVYSFDIPIKGNELPLQFVHNPHTDQSKTFPCVILYNGVQLISGDLYVQKSTDESLTAAIVVNPYPDGFSTQSIRQNGCESITISTSEATHKQEWLQFLTQSYNSDNFKFAPFVNEDGYGTDDADFGYWQGYSVGNYVNRLFFSDDSIITESDKPFIRIFPESNSFSDDDSAATEYNQFCFCPQIQLLYILKNIASEAGYTLTGNLLENDDFKRLYVQSGRALDGPSTQYHTDTDYYFHASTTPTSPAWQIAKSADVDEQHMVQSDGYINFEQPGFYEVHWQSEVGNVYMSAAAALSFQIKIPGGSACVNYSLGTMQSGITSLEYNGVVYIPPTFTNVGLFVGLVSEVNSTSYEMNPWASLSMRSTAAEEGWLNIFATKWTPAEYFPEVTNGDFITAICKSLGVALFVDAQTHTMELVPCAEVLKARAIDLTEYLLNKETEVELPEDSIQEFRFTPVSDNNEVDETDTPADVATLNDLPDAYLNIDNTIFVTDRNAFYTPTKVEDESVNYKLEWQLSASNTRPLITGNSGDTESEESDILIPGITDLDTDDNTRERKLCSSIPFNIASYINSDTDDLSDIILNYYRGHGSYWSRDLSAYIEYEDMLPTRTGETCLTTTGNLSWGEQYLRNWLELRDHHRTFTYSLRMPIVKALEVIKLMRPQSNTPENQCRAIMVDGVKSWPVCIELQLEDDADTVLVEIESATL